MLKSNYYHYLDADYTNDADFLFLNLCHSCNPRLKKLQTDRITENSIHVEYFRQRNGYR